MIEKQKAYRLMLLVVLCVIVGVLWAVTGSDRLRLVQTTANPNTTAQPGDSPNDYSQQSPVAAPQAKVEVKIPSADLFADYRLERDRARSTQIELLKSALGDKTLGDTRRDQLTGELFNLMKRSEFELQAETLLKAKGYTDAVVVLTQNGVNAVIPDILDGNDAARVGELVSRATGVAMERITIIDGASRS